MNESVGVRLLGPDDAAVLDNLVTDVFDGPVQPALVQEFLNDSRHHLAVAVLDGQVIGMASGVHYLHPDKPNAFWINEIGVAPAYQTQGIGRALMKRLLGKAEVRMIYPRTESGRQHCRFVRHRRQDDAKRQS